MWTLQRMTLKQIFFIYQLRPVKINVMFLISKTKSKKGGREVFFNFLFKTEIMTLDHVYNEVTGTV